MEGRTPRKEGRISRKEGRKKGRKEGRKEGRKMKEDEGRRKGRKRKYLRGGGFCGSWTRLKSAYLESKFSTNDSDLRKSSVQ